MKKFTYIMSFAPSQIPILNNQLKDIWKLVGKASYEKVLNSSVSPKGGEHGELKLSDDGTNKVLWINSKGTWTSVGNLISNIVDHVHSNTEGQGGQLDHGGLAGLSDDDHTQYHNDTRGDDRYYTKDEAFCRRYSMLMGHS